MLRSIALAFTLIIGAGTLLATALVPSAAVAAQADAAKQKLSPKVHKPLKAAQEAMQKEDWDGALAKIREAQAVPERTAFDDYQINEFLSSVAIRKKDFATAATASEAVLNSEFVDPASVADRVRQLTRLNFELKDYPKAVEYGKRWIEASGGNDLDAYVLTGQGQYLVEDNAGSIETMRAAVDAAKRAGKPVDEQWIQIILSAYDRMDDAAGVSATLEQYVELFPSQKRWKELLGTVYANPDNEDRTILEIHRLRAELDVMERADDYVEMSDIAASVGIPGEAAKAMEKALSEEMEAKDRDRRQARLAELKKTAEADRKSLPGLEKEAAASKTGEGDYAAGVGYLSFDEYQKAADAVKRGIQKGSLKRPDEAQLTLGRALLKLNRKDEAKQAFAAVPQNSKLARIARLWAIYADQKAAPPA
jgi:hypothetical protein